MRVLVPLASCLASLQDSVSRPSLLAHCSLHYRVVCLPHAVSFLRVPLEAHESQDTPRYPSRCKVYTPHPRPEHKHLAPNSSRHRFTFDRPRGSLHIQILPCIYSKEQHSLSSSHSDNIEVLVSFRSLVSSSRRLHRATLAHHSPHSNITLIIYTSLELVLGVSVSPHRPQLMHRQLAREFFRS